MTEEDRLKRIDELEEEVRKYKNLYSNIVRSYSVQADLVSYFMKRIRDLEAIVKKKELEASDDPEERSPLRIVR